MDMLFLTILFALSLGLLWGIWGLRANDVTYRQRTEILDSIATVKNDADKFWKLTSALQSVTYDQHFRAVLFFKDPYSLYDPILFAKV